jgi:hypothetical protein
MEFCTVPVAHDLLHKKYLPTHLRSIFLGKTSPHHGFDLTPPTEHCSDAITAMLLTTNVTITVGERQEMKDFCFLCWSYDLTFSMRFTMPLLTSQPPDWVWPRCHVHTVDDHTIEQGAWAWGEKKWTPHFLPWPHDLFFSLQCLRSDHATLRISAPKMSNSSTKSGKKCTQPNNRTKRKSMKSNSRKKSRSCNASGINTRHG